MRKSTILVVLEDCISDEKRSRIAELLQTLGINEFDLHITSAKLSQTAFGVDPWDVLDCPLCGHRDFVTVDLAGTWCNHCNAEFRIRGTAGDPGFVCDVRTSDVTDSAVKYPSLIGRELVRVVKTGDDDSGWIIKREFHHMVRRPALDFLEDPNEDTYSLEDGVPFNQDEL